MKPMFVPNVIHMNVLNGYSDQYTHIAWHYSKDKLVSLRFSVDPAKVYEG